MAVVTAAIANGGLVYRPRLVLGVRDPGQELFIERPPEVVNDMHWGPENVRAVREGMRDVVMAEGGTGRALLVPGITMAGKTGTAEFGKKEDRKRHAWMIAFAPYEAPKFAVTMIVEEGVSGAETAAPRMKRLMQGLFHAEAVGTGGDGAMGHWNDGLHPALQHSITPTPRAERADT
jgi:penicillin-binding protein 2